MSDYTLEQKALAFIRGQLWWRVPAARNEIDRNWSNTKEDCEGEAKENHLDLKGCEYHIGPTPPKELTDTEIELVEMLERLLAFNDFLRPNGSSRVEVENEAEALIKKVRGEA